GARPLAVRLHEPDLRAGRSRAGALARGSGVLPQVARSVAASSRAARGMEDAGRAGARHRADRPGAVGVRGADERHPPQIRIDQRATVISRRAVTRPPSAGETVTSIT